MESPRILIVDDYAELRTALRRRLTAENWEVCGEVGGGLEAIEVGTNPWRGDSGHNPWRAWPTDYENDLLTWSSQLPAVHRPAAGPGGVEDQAVPPVA